MTLAEALAAAAERLARHESARLEAQVLLAHVLERPRSYLFAWPERALGGAEEAAYFTLVERRAAGEPVAYLTGEREFWSLTLRVTPDTLIPRPETELLVERALAVTAPDAAVLDLGTGSGAIAIAIARECPGCRVTAVERSPGALAVARENAERHHADNLELLAGEWFAPLAGHRFDVIVSNPPYVADAAPHLRAGDVRFEPRSALAAGADGLDDIRAIAAGARGYLNPGGRLLLEHGWDQAAAVATLLTDYGYREIRAHRDGAGHLRVSEGICDGGAVLRGG